MHTNLQEKNMNLQLKLISFTPDEKIRLANWISGETWPFHVNNNPTYDDVVKRIENGDFIEPENRTFWIMLPDNPEPAALVILQELSDPTPVFDLRIKGEFRGKGLGRLILDELTRLVFTTTEKHRMEGHTRADNIAMRRVFKKCGWVMEAFYRHSWPDAQGGFHDAVAYAILKSDWESGTTTPADLQDIP